MTAQSDEIRGSTPVYTAKDILVGLDAKVDLISSQITVLSSQNLGDRVTQLEKFQNRLTGLAWLGPILAAIAVALQLLGVTPLSR